MTTRQMQPPARQPIGFWTTKAAEAIGTRTRGVLGNIGVAQPEWWVLQQLSDKSVGMSTRELIDIIGSNNGPDAIVDAVASASAKGWIIAEGDTLAITTDGLAVYERAAQVQQALQAERMHGISESDYATAIRVLQRTIENVGEHAWRW